MEQEVAINKVLRDLKMNGLISEEANGEVKLYLNALWICGWEQARMEMAGRTNKPVIQEDTEHHFIKEYKSIENASKQMKVSRETIARAIKTSRLTIKRHYWKFKTLNSPQ